ncbi:hypothetical protein JAAARDRAFT_43253 [Jaapia argillacea MUCL 33604]|uniref:Uncharacterized protein n=1 Tax=Jaapia argillacea MUCL 33604 TaxID=933084 RepID=A0A067QAN8_9AGAM|nr:hypothetical protein JAAARDRAFT_43253 [Jaapia argillacea MUCL 33604]
MGNTSQGYTANAARHKHRSLLPLPHRCKSEKTMSNSGIGGSAEHMNVDKDMAQSHPSSQNLAYSAYAVPSSQSSSYDAYADLVPSPEPAFDAYEEAENGDEVQSTQLPPAPKPTTSHSKEIQPPLGPSHDGQIPPAHPSPTAGGFSLFGPPSNNSPLLPLPVGGIFNSPPFIPETWVNDRMGDFFTFQGLDAGMSPIECQNQLHGNTASSSFTMGANGPAGAWAGSFHPNIFRGMTSTQSHQAAVANHVLHHQMAIQNEFVAALAQQLQEANFLAQCLDTGLTSMELIRAALLAAEERDSGLPTEGS